jgi:hypothetical protein
MGSPRVASSPGMGSPRVTSPPGMDSPRVASPPGMGSPRVTSPPEELSYVAPGGRGPRGTAPPQSHMGQKQARPLAPTGKVTGSYGKDLSCIHSFKCFSLNGEL